MPPASLSGIKDAGKEAYARLPYRVIALLVPLLVFLLPLALIAATLPWNSFLTLTGLMVAYMLPPAGKETVIPVGIVLGIPWITMALAIALIDIATGLFMVLNFDLVYRLPWLGPFFVRLTDSTRDFLNDHRWLKGMWFFAVVLMVMVPVFGSGGVRGSLAGKLLGLGNPLTFAAVVAGALIGCFGIALGSDAILVYLCANGSLPDNVLELACGT
ncbi:MAG: small multi-drug export protein [Methanomicrobiales archaeon]|nr:small multi-drug export protein [Methanomicrobiales archaeon]